MKMPMLPKMKMPKLPKLPKPQQKRLQATARRAAQPAVEDDYDEEPTTRLSSAFVVVLILHVVAVGGIYAFNSIKAHRRGQDIVATPAPATPVKSSAEANSQTTAPAEQSGNASAAPVAAAALPVTPPQPPSTSVTPISGNRIYHVRSGDTLWRIASVYGVSIEDLAAANGLTVESKLQLNRALNIPAVKGPANLEPGVTRQTEAPSSKKTEPVVKAATPVKATPARSVKAATPAKASGTPSSRTYTVKKGENPVTIAKRLGVSYEELLKLNKITDPRKLRIGQVLKLPAKKGN